MDVNPLVLRPRHRRNDGSVRWPQGDAGEVGCRQSEGAIDSKRIHNRGEAESLLGSTKGGRDRRLLVAEVAATRVAQVLYVRVGSEHELIDVDLTTLWTRERHHIPVGELADGVSLRCHAFDRDRA